LGVLFRRSCRSEEETKDRLFRDGAPGRVTTHRTVCSLIRWDPHRAGDALYSKVSSGNRPLARVNEPKKGLPDARFSASSPVVPCASTRPRIPWGGLGIGPPGEDRVICRMDLSLASSRWNRIDACLLLWMGRTSYRWHFRRFFGSSITNGRTGGRRCNYFGKRSKGMCF
jgi:hypothetical protein